MYMIDANQFIQHCRIEKEEKIRGGLYHQTQILLAYNSNRMEGNDITENETRDLFEDGFIKRAADIQAIVNHFLPHLISYSTILMKNLRVILSKNFTQY